MAYLARPDLVVAFANSACRWLAGDRDVTGLPLGEALPELAAQGRLELIRQAMETGTPARGHEASVRLRRPGQQEEQRYVDFVLDPVRDPAGGIAGVLLYATDVTAHVLDRRRLKALAGQLAATEERYRTLFETMPQGVIYYGSDGSIIGVNPAASKILGPDGVALATLPGLPARRAVHEDGSPCRPEDHPVMVALRTGKVVTDTVLGVPHTGTGELRWLRMTAVPDARDPEGRPQRAYSIFTDQTEQHQVKVALQESTSLLGRLREANVLGVAASSEQGTYDANDAFLDIIGYSRDDLAAGRISYGAITAPEWAGADLRALRELRTSGAFQPYEKEYLHRDGRRVPVLVGAAVVDHDPLRWVTFVVDLTARQRAEQERAGLLAREQVARADADTSRERLGFLLRAGRFVAATHSRHQLLDHAAHLVVPTLADHCVVFLPDEEGMLAGTSLAHRDPSRAPVLAEFRDHRIPAAGPMSTQIAYTTGTTQVVRDAAARISQWGELGPDIGETLARLRADSILATPLTAGQHTLGVMALARDADRPAFSESDVAVVEEFARRLADGMANADTFAREHAIAETLQRAVLPGTLPEFPGLNLAVSYLPATEGADVGGDWYDAFPLDDDRVGLVIGDVTGHSITSASIMGQVRSVLRAYAMDDPEPADVLQRTGAAMVRLLPEAMATAVYAVLHVATGELSYANAGHPPPLITIGGRVEYLDDAPGIMLGAAADLELTAGRRKLPRGAGLLFYTDGLIEGRERDIDEGLSALAATLTRSRARTAKQIRATAESVLHGTESRADDICLLAAQLRD